MDESGGDVLQTRLDVRRGQVARAGRVGPIVLEETPSILSCWFMVWAVPPSFTHVE